MKLTVVDHSDKLIKMLNDFKKEMVVTLDDALKETAKQIKNEMVDAIMDGDKSGHMYGDHQASAPGEAPANYSGDLVRSLKVKVTSKNEIQINGDIHAAYMEYGTSKIAPRPFIAPSIDTVSKNLKKIYQQHMSKLKK